MNADAGAADGPPDRGGRAESGESALSCRRDAFHLPADRHYLNCAYMAPLLRAAEDAGARGIRRRRAPHTIGPADFFSDADRARERFAALIGSPEPSRVAIVPSASYGIATAARNLRVGRGQNIVVAGEQFPSNVYAWRRLCRHEQLELRAVHPPARDGGRAALWNERLLDAIDRDTVAVAAAPVHWTDGTRFDLEAIGERARERGAVLVIDGTQSVGALPFDIERVRPDALICASYKWLLGPFSLGLAWFGPYFDDGEPLEETWLAREGSEDFAGLVDYRDAYQPGAVRYDMGERSNFVLLPMLIAALEALLDWRPERIQRYCRALTAGLVDELRGLGYRIEDDEHRAAHLFGIRPPPGLPSESMQAALDERGIVASVRGSAVRISPNVYNDPADIEALLAALREARRARAG